MVETAQQITPRTTTDVVFDHLREQILSLQLLPGTRISEADIANKLGVSRQPVRDAFNRLGNLNLLRIRPQRATIVSGFSISQILNTRFIRLAVELEVARHAHRTWTNRSTEAIEAVLDLQRSAIKAGQIDTFHRLDYDFHGLICTLGGQPLAFETIENCKQQVDRLCVLSLSKAEEVSAVLSDHEEIANALEKKSFETVEAVLRSHLGRLDATISDIYKKHAEYFE
ncbi:MAG: GntR family transcriptional regulator [Pseudomonadota bacterium]